MYLLVLLVRPPGRPFIKGSKGREEMQKCREKQRPHPVHMGS